ncbi:hypothetical protein QFC21_002260 [Naganishia friedmannii]|uniref:Uncharacterized protein n=1 Tax=Naganishia friedmannii TaxID=89922 RepID=A0ACC2VX96_9TREE|nr:hypothetical protein QFC21_002260 [Naganishia friedmannii]
MPIPTATAADSEEAGGVFAHNSINATALSSGSLSQMAAVLAQGVRRVRIDRVKGTEDVAFVKQDGREPLVVED